MSNKQWAVTKNPVTKEVWEKSTFEHPGASQEGQEHVAVAPQPQERQAQKPKMEDRYPSPFTKGLDASVWLAWEEMDGDEDGSGELALCSGDLDYEKTRMDPLGKFFADPLEGPVMIKLADAPVWATAFGQNIGPSMSGHCMWEMTVLRRDGNMYIGMLIPQGVTGELDRRWDTKCWFDQAFFWATTAGALMNGPKILKTLPTTKVPVCHFNNGDVVTLDLKVDQTEFTGTVISVDNKDLDLTNFRKVKIRIDSEGRGSSNLFEQLPQIYFDSKVYTPEDFDMLDQTFAINMREECEVGEKLPFQFTGQLVILVNGLTVGKINGVPHDAAPAVCLTNKGDMVKLQGAWSHRDQKLINQVRGSLVTLLKDMDVALLLQFAEDSQDGLVDWVILKALRTCEYKADDALEDLAEYCEQNAADNRAKKAAKLRQLKQKNALSAFQEDTTVSDRFCLRDMSREAKKWAPKTIDEALKWKPGGRHHDKDDS